MKPPRMKQELGPEIPFPSFGSTENNEDIKADVVLPPVQRTEVEIRQSIFRKNSIHQPLDEEEKLLFSRDIAESREDNYSENENRYRYKHIPPHK